jgi:hypothetical protein
MTMRLPADVEAQLRENAGINTRTLADQILHYVKAGIAFEDSQRTTLAQQIKYGGTE